jgi:hypothetical protein
MNSCSIEGTATVSRGLKKSSLIEGGEDAKFYGHSRMASLKLVHLQ